MPIKAQCGNCKTSFKAKDALAGKKVKCPKCATPLRIPGAKAKAAAAVGAGAKPVRKSAAPVSNPMLDLIRDAGVQSVSTGPTCPSCSSDMDPAAILCVECGYNTQTGQQLATEIGADEGESYGSDKNSAQKLIERADRELDESSLSDVAPDFGDGADSMLIAGGAVVIAAVLVGIGLAIIFLMDSISEFISPSMISFCASIGLYLLCAIWITVVALMMKPVHGVVCILSAGLYCIIFGFMQGKTLIMPTIILLASIFIGLLSSFFAFQEKNPYVLLDPELLESARLATLCILG